MPYAYVNGKPVYVSSWNEADALNQQSKRTKLPKLPKQPTAKNISTTTTTTPKGYDDIRNFITGGLKDASSGRESYERLKDLYANPLSSSLFTNTIGPILDMLRPSEDASRRQLEDTFRKSGAIGSGAQAYQGRLLEGDILGKRGQVVASHAGDIYSRLLSGIGLGANIENQMLNSYGMGISLLNSLKGGTTTQSGEQFQDPLLMQKLLPPKPMATLGSYYYGGGGGGGGGGNPFGSGLENIQEMNKFLNSGYVGGVNPYLHGFKGTPYEAKPYWGRESPSAYLGPPEGGYL